MRQHDRHYRRLFGHPAFMRALLDGLLPPEWRRIVDPESLAPLPTDYPGAKQQDRQSDLLWRIRRTDGHRLFLLVLLEHQTAPDRLMALRILSYAALGYETLSRRKLIGPVQRLPALLPIVLYTGLKPWRHAPDVAALIDPVPPALRPFHPTLHHLLIDAGARVRRRDLPGGNLASQVFELEHNEGIAHATRVMHTLCDTIARSPDHAELRHIVGAWVRYVVLPRALPGTIPLPDTDDITEITMTVAHSRDWTLRPRMEGRLEGQADLLKRLLMKKFGLLPPAVVQRLAQASTDQIEAWSLNFVDAHHLDEVFRED